MRTKEHHILDKKIGAFPISATLKEDLLGVKLFKSIRL